MFSFMRQLFGTSTRARRPRRPASARLQVESLEQRQVMSVTPHGGAVLPNVQVNAVFYGSGWDNDPSGVASAAENHVQGFLPDVLNSPYMDMLTAAGYGVGRGNSYWNNVWDDLDTTQAVTDASLRATLQGWINNHVVPDVDPLNSLYVIYVQPNQVVDATALPSAGLTTQQGMLGYHSSFAGNDSSGNPVNVRYAVIAYPGGTAGNSSLGWLSAQDQLTQVSSHEIAEAATDPDSSGWYEDSTGSEIGEAGTLAVNPTVYVDGYAVQRIADQNDQPMTPSDATASRPVTFVVQNRLAMYDGGRYMFFTPTVYEQSSDGFQTVTFANGNVLSNVRSISPQGIDNHGRAMIDVVDKSGYAYEVHDGGYPVYLGSGVQDAKAGQGVSYLLKTNGDVVQYTDANGTLTTLDHGVSAIDAGTDRYGENMLAEIWQNQGWTYSVSTDWTQFALNVAAVSAGRQGYVAWLDLWGAAFYKGDGNSLYLGSGVTQITAGYDQGGGLVLDLLYSNGNVYDWRAASGMQFLDYDVRAIGKARAGVVDDVSRLNNGWEFDPWFDYTQVGANGGVQQIA